MEVESPDPFESLHQDDSRALHPVEIIKDGRLGEAGQVPIFRSILAYSPSAVRDDDSMLIVNRKGYSVLENVVPAMSDSKHLSSLGVDSQTIERWVVLPVEQNRA